MEKIKNKGLILSKQIERKYREYELKIKAHKKLLLILCLISYALVTALLAGFNRMPLAALLMCILIFGGISFALVVSEVGLTSFTKKEMKHNRNEPDKNKARQQTFQREAQEESNNRLP